HAQRRLPAIDARTRNESGGPEAAALWTGPRRRRASSPPGERGPLLLGDGGDDAEVVDVVELVHVPLRLDLVDPGYLEPTLDRVRGSRGDVAEEPGRAGLGGRILVVLVRCCAESPFLHVEEGERLRAELVGDHRDARGKRRAVRRLQVLHVVAEE